MEEGANGTVTSLASMFPADEARKAAERVQDAIAEKSQELNRVKGFIADNAGLVGLVQKLPEELHHDVMIDEARGSPVAGEALVLRSTNLNTKHMQLYGYNKSDAKLGDAKDVREAIRKAMLKVLDFLYVTPNLKGFEAAAAARAEEVAVFASASESFFQFKHKWQHIWRRVLNVTMMLCLQLRRPQFLSVGRSFDLYY